MNRSDVVKILTFISASYSQFKYPLGEEDFDTTFEEVWFEMLREFDYRLVATATKRLVSTKKYPPSIHDMLSVIRDITRTPEDNIIGPEAYGMVIEAARRWGVYYEDEAREALPAKIWRTIEAMGGFHVICHSEEGDTFLRNQFIKFYEMFREKDDDTQKLPPSLRQETALLAERFTLHRGGSNHERDRDKD